LPDRENWPPSSLMAALADDERAALLAQGKRVHFHDKDIIVLQGADGDSLYVLTAGVVRITMAAENGTEAVLAIRSRGDLIGEVALFDDKPRAATASAIGEVAAARISRASFRAFAASHPLAWAMIMKSVVAKMRESDERRAQRGLPAQDRLALVVFQLAAASADRNSDGSVVIPLLTQGDIADLAGVGVASAERFFADFRRQGILATSYKQVAVLDMSLLEKIVTHR
jgi:CRP/FNR family transcriptional regulator, cyclic AMP receptor protein